MKVLFFCPYWGSEALSVADFCRKAKAAGYDGVELSLPFGDSAGTASILSAIRGEGLAFIAQQWQMADADLKSHKDEFRRRLEWLVSAEPLFINSQTGKDWFPYEWNRELLDLAQDIAAASGLRIVHETHRGKFGYSAAVTARFLREDPSLRLSADFSHWCVVSESLLDDQSDSLDLAIERADHIHSRVGFEEGPQVADPRAPQATAALEAHLLWWDRIVARRKKEGAVYTTITPEFGPWPYMPSLPWTGQAIADQWGINVHMMRLLRERWAAR